MFGMFGNINRFTIILDTNGLLIDHDINLLASFSVGLLLRLSAIRFGWSLPVFSYAPGKWEH